MYGEESVQENLHAATTLKLLDSNDCNFLAGQLSYKEVVVVKKRIIESILHTDMAQMK